MRVLDIARFLMLSRGSTYISLITVLFLHVVALKCKSADYYVATNGNNSWSGTAPEYLGGNIGPWATPAKASSSVLAGDTIYIRGGLYDGSSGDASGMYFYFYPSSGSLSSPIVVTNFPGEVPVMTGNNGNYAHIDLRWVNHIRIFGITITNAGRSISLVQSKFCEVAYCTVGPLLQIKPVTGSLVSLFGGAQSNWLHHCTFFGGGVFKENVWENGHVLEIGAQVGVEAANANNFNLIEHNNIYWGGHDVVTIAGSYNIFRFNYVHNEPWQYYKDQVGLWGERCLEVGGSNCVRNLIDSNRIGWAGTPESGNNGGAGITSETKYGIFRRNEIFNCMNFGIEAYTKYYSVASSNYYYHNTLFNNGNLGPSLWTNHNGIVVGSDTHRAAINIVNSTNNVFKNNIYSHNSGNRYYYPKGGTNFVKGYVAGNNSGLSGAYLDNPDPKFVNPSGSDPFSKYLPNLKLQEGSPAIDSGEWLTTIISPDGSGLTFKVQDPNFFWIGYMVQDEIQLAGQTQTAKVTFVDYKSGDITVDTPLSWKIGQGISLAYRDNAPDMGANEWGANANQQPPLAPKNFRLITSSQ